MLVEKEIIRPGSYFYIDEKTSQPRRLDVDGKSIDYWLESGQKMLAAGLSVPVPFEHQPEAKPLSAAEKSANTLKNNAGWVNGYQKKKIKDGDKEIDALFATLDIADPAIAKKLPNTIRWTSPWFSSFTAGDGQDYQGVIGHVALTTRPRITKQQPFANSGAALSLALPSPQRDGFSLSRAGLFADGKPLYPVAFSLYSGAVKPRAAKTLDAVKLAIEDMKAKEDKPKPKDGEKPPAKPPEGKPGEGAKPPMGGEGAEEIAQEVESLVDADGDISVWDVICDLLETEGYECGEGITSENAAERLYQIFMDKVKSKGAGTDMNKPPDSPMTPPAAPEPKVQAPPVYMSANLSLEDIGKIANEQERGIALSLYQQRTKIAALEKNALEGAKAVRKARVDAVKLKLPKESADKLQALSDGAKFALGDDGVVKDDFAEALAVFETGLKIDVPDLLKNGQAAFTVQPHPAELGGAITEERRQAIVNEVEVSTGGSPVYK